MNSMTTFEAGYLAGPSLLADGANAPSRMVERNLSRLWSYRRMLRSPLVQPFRTVLRPLVRWVFSTHVFVYDEERPGLPFRLNLKPLETTSALVGLLVAPLIFVLLLPLLLILVPIGVAFVMIALLASAMQFDDTISGLQFDPAH